MVSCSVLGCKSHTERKIGGISFHAFPKDPETKLKWIITTGKNNWHPTKFSKICSNHFKDDLLDKEKQRTQLHNGAVPTLQIHNIEENLPSSQESGAFLPLCFVCYSIGGLWSKINVYLMCK